MTDRWSNSEAGNTWQETNEPGDTTSMDVQQRSREAAAFLDTLQDTPPDVVSACEGWTAHEVTAHLAAAAAEVTCHLKPHLEGRRVPATRSFEEREAPYRAMDDRALRRRLESEEAGMRDMIDQVLRRDPEATIPWTGREMPVVKFIPHLRNEFALHRWDIAGDDEVSFEILGQPALTEHAVSVLGPILLGRGLDHDPNAGEDFDVRLGAAGTPDVRLAVKSGLANLELAENSADEPDVELDPAARCLVIWGRRPAQRQRVRSHLSPPALGRLQVLLSGY